MIGDEQITKLALAAGFTLQTQDDGTLGLHAYRHSYVVEFARAIYALDRAPLDPAVEQTVLPELPGAGLSLCVIRFKHKPTYVWLSRIPVRGDWLQLPDHPADCYVSKVVLSSFLNSDHAGSPVAWIDIGAEPPYS